MHFIHHLSLLKIGDTNERQNPNGIPNVAWGSLLPVNIERTLPTYASDTKPTDGSWQIVNGTRFKFFVFSAFYDRRGGKLIRIIGATKTRVPEKVWCRFLYNTGNATAPSYRSVSVMARVKVCIHMCISCDCIYFIHMRFILFRVSFESNYIRDSFVVHVFLYLPLCLYLPLNQGDTRKLEFEI